MPIELLEVSKRYPGQKRPAVEKVTLHIPAGEIVVLVGPSGCGKTTLMKMINRLIEPTAGRVLIDGEDVSQKDPDQLRRQIGYVIQAGGLFPHMTVAANVAIVPNLLGWDKQRINERIHDLLDLVGLEPEVYRDRYPRELSGGQQQRVGVARALAADPPILLMDEPFGAVDPITRSRLQDELLRLQEELGKTIVFVTHDFDEAIKLGDRIAVLGQGSQIMQYDTPAEILANPANDFVVDFVGAGAALKQLNLARVQEVEIEQWPTAEVGEDAREVAKRVRQADKRHALVLDDRGRPLRWAEAEGLEHRGGVVRPVTELRESAVETVGRRATLNDALDAMLGSSHGVVVVVGSRDRYQGVVTIDTIARAIQEMREAGRAASSAMSATPEAGQQ